MFLSVEDGGRDSNVEYVIRKFGKNVTFIYLPWLDGTVGYRPRVHESRRAQSFIKIGDATLLPLGEEYVQGFWDFRPLVMSQRTTLQI